jgi:hypothetical protein
VEKDQKPCTKSRSTSGAARSCGFKNGYVPSAYRNGSNRTKGENAARGAARCRGAPPATARSRSKLSARQCRRCEQAKGLRFNRIAIGTEWTIRPGCGSGRRCAKPVTTMAFSVLTKNFVLSQLKAPMVFNPGRRFRARTVRHCFENPSLRNIAEQCLDRCQRIFVVCEHSSAQLGDRELVREDIAEERGKSLGVV